MKIKLITAALAGALLAGAAACTDEVASASPKHHAKAHKTTSHIITAKGHTEGTGRYFLTLRGAKLPAAVTKRTFKRCGIGDHYPACADN
jgi:hypothetical protein